MHKGVIEEGQPVQDMEYIISILKKFVLLYPIIIVIPILILLSFFNTPLYVFPHPEYRDRISVYVDNELGGNSEIIDFDIMEDAIIFTYMLKRGTISAFAGISFDVSLLDISAYDIMEMDITATSPAHLLLTLMSFVEGESRLSELDTFLHFNTNIDIKEVRQTCKIDLNHLTKTGYAKMEKVHKNNGGDNRPTQLLFIHLKEIINADNIEKNSDSFNRVKTLIIGEISFSRSYILYYYLIATGVLLYYSLYILYILLGKKKGRSPRHHSDKSLPSIHLDVESYEQEDLRKIMNILQADIFDPEFSIHSVYEKTGQSRSRIAALVKEKYGLSFKQLTNSIRLNEAKRLLLESDLKIYDIAFKIGYNNNTYFCKLFKKECGLSPKEFRHQHIS